jgi:uncharacterized protein YggE
MILRTVVCAALMVPSLALADALPSPGVPPPQVVASASGEARLAPDRATILIGVETRAPTAAAAARENNGRQQAVIAAIVSAGIPREQISTESYNVIPDTRSDRPGQNPVVVGYVVTNVVRVDVRRTAQVGPVIDAALGKGANRIQSLEFYSSNTDVGRRQALAEAIGKARGDAEAMARAAGGKLGSLLEASTVESGPRPLYRLAGVSEKSAFATPIEPGELTLRVEVTTRWHFVPNP